MFYSKSNLVAEGIYEALNMLFQQLRETDNFKFLGMYKKEFYMLIMLRPVAE